MPLKPGAHLGPYEVRSPLGAGGMGEVYKAYDPRLKRDVAIKVLPEHLAVNAELRERFKREAETIASLKHPHICVLYDIGQQDGIDYLVMEYIEGETLAQRLLKGPLPLEQVLRYAIELSDALDKAHRKNITHRDIKPGNIMLTKEGSKLLDFGLAKLKQEARKDYVLDSQAPTPPPGGPTIEGTILGTMQYMAPEQLEGKKDNIDSRTDIFAFGATVYEMATGKKAFQGASSTSLIAAILRDDPAPISSLQPPGKMSPPALDRVVKTCLHKERDDRWQSAADLCRELQWIHQSRDREGAIASGTGLSPVLEGQLRGPALLGWRKAAALGAAVLIGAVIASVAAWLLKPAATQQQVSRFTITLPTGDRLAAAGSNPALAISPDGSRLVYAAIRGGAQQLYVRDIGALEAKPLAGTEGGFAPFFSPDGQWIGFFAGASMKKISITGGAAVTLCPAFGSGVAGAAWGSDGAIVFHYQNFGGLWQVAETGGTSKQVISPDSKKAEVAHRWPQLLPGGKAVLFAASTAGANWSGAQVAVGELGSGERRDPVLAGSRPAYAASGHLVYAQAGTLMAVPFDPRRLELRGAAVPILEGVAQSINTGVAQYTFSVNGSLVYVPGSIQATQSMLTWVDRKGAEQPLKAAAHGYRSPKVSPDGRRVAVSIEEQGTQIWTYDLDRETLTRLTFQGSANGFPVWTPDGKRIAFQSNSAGRQNLFWQPSDGSGGSERLSISEFTQAANSFSPDGQLLAFTDTSPNGRDIWVLRLSDRKAQPFLKTPAEDGAPGFSPDGRWLAYSSDESGRREIYVQPYPGPGGKWQISTDGGQEPVWNPNGKELFYRSGSKIMAVDVNQSRDSNGAGANQGNPATPAPATFSAGAPHMLFEGQYLLTPSSLPNYDVSPDGQRFLMLKPTEQEAAPTQINVVLNWFEELKKKVPVK